MSTRVAQRRSRTMDEVVATALDVMAETGAAGLSLGQVARRMGMQTPSLYVYFDSKASLCDEIFARGWRDLRGALAPMSGLTPTTDLSEHIEAVSRALVAWALAHPGHAQLMFWRPIAGWEPAPDAYAHAVGCVDDLRSALERARDLGLVRPDADVREMSEVLTILTTGVVSQQLANEPGVPFELGAYAAHLGRLASMVAQAFGSTERKATS